LITEKTVQHHLQKLRNLCFEVTEAYNLNCTYCAFSDFYRAYEKREAKMFSFEKARIIIDYEMKQKNFPPDLKFPFTISFYGGEPLLNVPFIRQVVEYMEKTYSSVAQISYNMTTNAILLDKYMDFLAEKQIKLLISLDNRVFRQYP